MDARGGLRRQRSEHATAEVRRRCRKGAISIARRDEHCGRAADAADHGEVGLPIAIEVA